MSNKAMAIDTPIHPLAHLSTGFKRLKYSTLIAHTLFRNDEAPHK